MTENTSTFTLAGDTDKAKALRKKLLRYIASLQEEGKPFVIGATAVYSIQLPDLSGEDKLARKYLMEHLVDNRMLSELEETSVINFCPNVQKLYPLKTVGDGNCLLHAVSMAIWGLHDEKTLLRRLLYIRMVEDDNRAIYKRWKAERERLDQELPEGVQLSKQQWASEWDITVKCAEDEKKMAQKNVLPYESLEEIHIFVLANIIQRPIIVLSELVIRSLLGSVLGPNNFAGVYLPLLCEPSRCCKTPVILGYHMAHFTPLVNMKASTESQVRSSAKYVVPLVSKNLEPLYIHFLPRDKDNKALSILQAYMNMREIEWIKSDGTSLLLAAELDHIQIKDKYDLMNEFVTRIKDIYVAGEIQKKPPKKKQMEKKSNIISAEENRLYTGNKNKMDRKQVETFTASSQEKKDVIEDTTENRHCAQTLINSKVSKAGCFIKPFGQNCISAGCRNEGTIECAGYCFQCFLKKTAEGGRTKEKLERPFEYQPSITNMRCQFHEQCMNLASTKTFPYCHDHAGAELKAGKGCIMSLTDYQCHYQSCVFAASSETFPFCHVHKNQRKNLPLLMSVSTQPAQRQQNLAEESDHESILLSMLPDKCAVTDCINHASKYTFPFCHEHFPNEEKQIERLHSSSLPSMFRHVDVHEPAKKYSSLSDTEKPSSSKCLVPGCLLYGPPGSKGLCTQHQIQKMMTKSTSPSCGNNKAIHKCNEESTKPIPATAPFNEIQALLEQPLSGDQSEQTCIGPLCQNKVNRQKRYLCDVCYATLLKKPAVQQSHNKEIESYKLELSNQSKPGMDKPGCSSFDRDQFHELGTNYSEGTQVIGGLAGIEKNLKKSVRKCISGDCNNFGNPLKKGYCNQCYKLLEQHNAII